MRTTQPDPLQLEDVPAPQAGRLIAGRYLLGAALGEGGFGTVYKAQDRLGNAPVALKLMQGLGQMQLARVRREVAALRLLRLPGVVQLLDEGDDHGDRFLVMELVEGEHFPGRHGSDWNRLAPVALGLLETLARVHTAGVVHRDLKPANVLVSAEGRVTILDFGISRGEPVGTTVTGEGMLVGTPGYLAPEQILGQRADIRSDLYAIGIMLFEALAGRPPHLGPGPAATMRARVMEAAPRLRQFAPDVPQEVADVIERLLALQPAHRPMSAGEVLRQLRGELGESSAQLPWLGDDAIVREAAQRVLAGVSTSIAGPPGAGRSRVLQEVARRLVGSGRPLVWLRPSRLPFGSLGTLRPGDAHLRGLDLEHAAAAVQAHLAVRAKGTLLLADEWERLDRWTAAILGALWQQLTVLRAVPADTPDALTLATLNPGDLRALFLGHQRLLHVPEDAARLLHARAGGRPGPIRAEVEAWVHAGLAVWQDGRLAVGRTAIDRLASLPALAEQEGVVWGAVSDTWTQPAGAAAQLAGEPALRDLLAWLHLAWPHTRPELLAAAMDAPPWQVEAGLAELLDVGAARRLADGRFEPQCRLSGDVLWTADQLAAAHLAIARVMPVGTDRRFFHVVAAGAAEEVAVEALALARILIQRGRLGEVEAILVEALRILRREKQGDHEAALLGRLLEVAWATGTVRALSIALYEVERSLVPDAALFALTSVALQSRQGGGDAVLDLAQAVPPFADETIDTIRQSVKKHAARACSLARDEAVVADLQAWAAQRDTPSARAHAALWTARLRYRQGRYDEAADLDSEALQFEDLPLDLRLTTMTYGASSLLSAFRYGEANELARRTRDLADAGRHVQAAARAEWILRSSAYRQGQPMAPDLELVEAVASAGLPHLAVSVTFTEATIAWRAQALELCADLAADGHAKAEALHMEPFVAVLHLLNAVANPDAPRPDAATIALKAESAGDAEVALQIYGLGALVLGASQPQWLGAIERHAASLGKEAQSRRLDLLSADEARQAVRTGQIDGRPLGGEANP